MDLRLALVDGDEGAHVAVQEMLATHARGWSMHSYRDTVLAMRGIPAARPHVVLLELSHPRAFRYPLRPKSEKHPARTADCDLHDAD